MASTAPQPRLLSIRQTCQITSLSRTGLWRKVKDDQFPAPIRLGDGGARKAFVATEVDAWINARIADRDMERAT